MEEIKKRTIRGKEDKDERFFSSKEIERLRHAQEEVVWLLNRNYPISNIIDFEGINFQQDNAWQLEGQVAQSRI